MTSFRLEKFNYGCSQDFSAGVILMGECYSTRVCTQEFLVGDIK